MTGDQCRRAILRVGMTQVAAAKFLGVDDSTVRRWLTDKLTVPTAVALLLSVMARLHLSADDVMQMSRRAVRVAS